MGLAGVVVLGRERSGGCRGRRQAYYNHRVDRTERFYKIQQLIHRHKAVPARRFLAELEISHATFKRDLEYLRSRLNIPIVWDRESSGYRYDPQAQLQELPGLWFNAQEIHALLTMKHLLESSSPVSSVRTWSRCWRG